MGPQPFEYITDAPMPDRYDGGTNGTVSRRSDAQGHALWGGCCESDTVVGEPFPEPEPEP